MDKVSDRLALTEFLNYRSSFLDKWTPFIAFSEHNEMTKSPMPNSYCLIINFDSVPIIYIYYYYKA